MDDAQIRMTLRHGADRAKRDEVFAAEQERNLPRIEDFRSTLLDHFKGAVWCAERKFKVAGVEYARILRDVTVLEHRIRFDAKALRAHRGRPEARSRTKGRG